MKNLVLIPKTQLTKTMTPTPELFYNIAEMKLSGIVDEKKL